MTRICGVCKQPPREGQEMRPIRLREGDLAQLNAAVSEEGLYSACLDCYRAYRQMYATTHDLEPEQVTNHMLC